MAESVYSPVEVITEDRPCIHCGYNLRGLMPDGRCPECGEQIRRSLRENLLEYADPNWLDRLYLGVNLKLWNIGLAIIFGMVGGLLMAVAPMTLLVLGGITGGALGLWATFAITTQEPRISLQEDTVTLRKVIRTCALAAFLGTLFQQARTTGIIGHTTYALGVLLSLAGLVVAFGELLYLRRFALRIPDKKLAKSTKILMWVIPILGAFGLVAGLLSALLARSSGSALTPTFSNTTSPPTTPPKVAQAAIGFATCFGMLLALVLFLWYVRLLYAYRRAFKEAAAAARGIDDEAGDPPGNAPPSARPLSHE